MQLYHQLCMHLSQHETNDSGIMVRADVPYFTESWRSLLPYGHTSGDCTAMSPALVVDLRLLLRLPLALALDLGEVAVEASTANEVW